MKVYKHDYFSIDEFLLIALMLIATGFLTTHPVFAVEKDGQMLSLSKDKPADQEDEEDIFDPGGCPVDPDACGHPPGTFDLITTKAV